MDEVICRTGKTGRRRPELWAGAHARDAGMLPPDGTGPIAQDDNSSPRGLLFGTDAALAWRRLARMLVMLPACFLLSCSAHAVEPGRSARYGMNLPPDDYWTPGQPWLDRMKTAAGWSQQGAPGDTQIQLDANGLPTAFPAGASMLYSMLNLEPGVTYEVTYKAKGKANFTLSLGHVVADRPGKFVFTWDGPNTMGQIIIKPGPLPTDMHVVRQDSAAAFAAGEIFEPEFLRQIEGFEFLRTMDMTQTNGSQRTDMIIADTPGSYTSGVPIAAIVALANRTGARPWINFPHLITDDGARAVFAYVKANLKPSIQPIFEYSNEVWNLGFSQAKWAQQVSPKPGDNLYWLGYRTGQLSRIAHANGFKMVLMSQFGVAFRFPVIYSGFKDSGGNDSDIEAAGAADYIFGTLTDYQKPDGPKLMATNDIEGALANLRKQLPELKGYHSELAAQVKAHGWKYWTYEGANFHLNTLFFGPQADALTAFYAKVQMDPRAADIISANTDAFRAAGGEVETAFNWSSPPSKGGYFGLIGTPTFEMMKKRMALNKAPH